MSDQTYKGNGEHKWEQVTGDLENAMTTFRLRVPGGWLYHTTAIDPTVKGAAATTDQSFVPMPEVVKHKV